MRAMCLALQHTSTNIHYWKDTKVIFQICHCKIGWRVVVQHGWPSQMHRTHTWLRWTGPTSLKTVEFSSSILNSLRTISFSLYCAIRWSVCWRPGPFFVYLTVTVHEKWGTARSSSGGETRMDITKGYGRDGIYHVLHTHVDRCMQTEDVVCQIMKNYLQRVMWEWLWTSKAEMTREVESRS